jgi:hypothetical protein
VSADLRGGVLALAATSRAEAAEAERRLPEFQALARAGAVLAKRVPDRLLADVRQAYQTGTARDKLRDLLAKAGERLRAEGRPESPALTEPQLAEVLEVNLRLMLDLCERAGEELLHVTDSSVRTAAALRARADALLEKAAQLEALAGPDPEPTFEVPPP